MSSVYRFPGGIHPQEGVGGKAATAGLPIVEVPQPSRVAIPLQQHIGAPCKPLVQKGDTVKAGQKIGEPVGFCQCGGSRFYFRQGGGRASLHRSKRNPGQFRCD